MGAYQAEGGSNDRYGFSLVSYPVHLSRILANPSRNFDEFVCDAYKFLMDYYKSGDKIYLFGFSRGAYTARALAGMIQRVSLIT